MKSQWELAKQEAYARQEGICLVCLKPLDEYIGHHRRMRCQNGPNTAANCECRHHFPCEVWAHRVHPTGNPTEDQKVAFRINPEAQFDRCKQAKRCKKTKKNRRIDRRMAKRQRRLLIRTYSPDLRELLRLYGPDPEKEKDHGRSA